jgi:hypothetical protein
MLAGRTEGCEHTRKQLDGVSSLMHYGCAAFAGTFQKSLLEFVGVDVFGLC